MDNPARPKADKAKARKGPRWWDTDEGVIAEGARRGIEPRVGEEMHDFRQRVFNTREQHA